MKYLTLLLCLAGLIRADTMISPNVELMSARLVSESAQTTVVGSGYFAYDASTSGNPVVVGIPDLVQFYLSLTYYYAGVPSGQYYSFGVDDLADFAFSLDADGNQISLTFDTNAADPNNPLFTTFHVFPNNGAYTGFGDTVSYIGQAVGTFDPEPGLASQIPESGYVPALLALLALGWIYFKFGRKC